MKKHAPPYVRTTAAVLLIGITTTPAQADDALIGEDYYLEQAPVVLSATRLAQPQYEAPVAVTVIDRAMIDASGALDIPDLLRLVPGFQIAHAKGHTASATYHGLADEHARRMQVLVDGRPVYGPAIGGVRWTDLPLDIKDIERIEVVRGPNAAAFGANAFLGAINIITQHPTQVNGTQLTLLRGNKDASKALLRHGDKLGKLNYRMTFGYRRDEGFKTRSDLAPPAPRTGEISNRLPLNDGMRVALFNFRGDYQLSNEDNLEFLAGYNGGPRSEGVFDDLQNLPRDREVQNHFQQVVWRRMHADDAETRVQFYHTYMRHREHSSVLLSDLGGIPPDLIGVVFPGHVDERIEANYGTFEERFELEAQHTQTFSNTLRAVWGGSGRLDRVGGDGKLSRDDLIENQLYRLFGNLEWRAYDRGTVNLGTMLEQSSQVGSQISPRLALNHQLVPNHGLHIGVSRATRLPTVYEEYADSAVRFSDGDLIDQEQLGSTELTPERIVSYEVGYLGQFPERKVTVDVKAFHDKLEDRIQAPKKYPYPADPFDGRAFLYTNSGALSVNGVETTLTYRPQKRSMLKFNWAYAQAKGRAIDSYEMSLNPAAWRYEDLGEDVPTHTYSVFGMHRLPHDIDISATYYKVSGMKWLGDGDRLRAQDRLDVRLAKQFRYAASSNSLALVAQNVLDEYLEFRDENVFDTRVYLELTLGLD